MNTIWLAAIVGALGAAGVGWWRAGAGPSPGIAISTIAAVVSATLASVGIETMLVFQAVSKAPPDQKEALTSAWLDAARGAGVAATAAVLALCVVHALTWRRLRARGHRPSWLATALIGGPPALFTAWISARAAQGALAFRAVMAGDPSARTGVQDALLFVPSMATLSTLLAGLCTMGALVAGFVVANRRSRDVG